VRLVPILVAQREQDRRLAAHRLDHGGLGDARGVTRYGVEAQRVESVGEDPRAPSRGCACASRDRARCCESGRTGPRLPVKTLIACARCWPEPQMVYRGYLPKTVYYSHCRKLPTEQFRSLTRGPNWCAHCNMTPEPVNGASMSVNGVASRPNVPHSGIDYGREPAPTCNGSSSRSLPLMAVRAACRTLNPGLRSA
jgi:hypothetical protein